MPDLLLELFSEEIPARMQARAADDLKKMITDRLVEAGLVYEGASAFATPRRLALTVAGLPVRSPDIREEKKGPRVGAPEQALAGFLKAAGLTSIAQAKVQPDKKGDFYVAVIEKPGRPALDVIAEIVPVVVKAFPWTKAMRWGAASAKPGALTWVRPLHSIVATFGPETEEPEVVRFSIGGIESGDVTRGHRFMAPAEIRVKRFDDYVTKLEAAKVVLDPARRREIILADAKNLAFAQGFELVEDEALLTEVAGLVEWPVVLMGSFDESFLAIPDAVIRATIRNNQKCFVVRQSGGAAFPSPHVSGGEGSRVGGVAASDDKSPHPRPLPAASGGRGEESSAARGALANRFILTANIEASDGGAAIVAGNERVIRARLSDAKFFFETDLTNWKSKPLDERLEKFKSIVFHEKLGTQFERIERIERLAAEIAPLVGADVEKAKRAARLCKADLLTEVVGEFPEVQGLMGRLYAEKQGEDASVALACEEHYKPVGPSDRVPTDPVSIAVALADKLDTLVGFWAIDEKPTGSKDPYALRRAALGVIRTVLAVDIKLPMRYILSEACEGVADHIVDAELDRQFEAASKLDEAFGGDSRVDEVMERDIATSSHLFGRSSEKTSSVLSDLLAFFADRLKVQLREQGARHDLVDAVFALGAVPTSPSRGEVAARSVAGGGEAGRKDHPTPPLRGDPPPPGEGEGSKRGESARANQDDLLLIVRRVEALGDFLDTDDGKNLLAGAKRAANILAIEEKKDGKPVTGEPEPFRLKEPEEQELARAVAVAKTDAAQAVASEDFAGAMRALAQLRAPVDAFFDKVMVNAEEPALRLNRLRLLAEIREATRTVADFSKIAG